jgi:hypothetical protein
MRSLGPFSKFSLTFSAFWGAIVLCWAAYAYFTNVSRIGERLVGVVKYEYQLQPSRHIRIYYKADERTIASVELEPKETALWIFAPCLVSLLLGALVDASVRRGSRICHADRRSL